MSDLPRGSVVNIECNIRREDQQDADSDSYLDSSFHSCGPTSAATDAYSRSVRCLVVLFPACLALN